MAAYFLCLTAGGGVPLFYRTKGALKSLPFPVIGSLNGVHMFAGTHDVELLSTTTPDAKVIWKQYYDSLTLIVVTQDDQSSDVHLRCLLDYIFLSMVLVYGLDDLMNIKNVERFKRDIKVCYTLVDCLLEQENPTTVAPLTQAVETLATPDNHILQTYLDAFADAASSPYGCLIVKGRIAVATKKWWQLSPVELVLLSLLVTSSPSCSSKDIPIFLPINSPKVPHRLLTYQLVSGVEVCLICGPTPTLAALNREVERFWRSSIDTLITTSLLYPRNLPSSLPLDNNILGFLLINTDTNRCLCTVQPFQDGRKKDSSPDVKERRNILRSFYKTTVGDYYKTPKLPVLQDENPDKEAEESEEAQTQFKHKVLDTYMCSETHKCYAMENGQFQLFLLYNTAIPTYAMRSVTLKTLTTLVQDKSHQLG